MSNPMAQVGSPDPLDEEEGSQGFEFDDDEENDHEDVIEEHQIVAPDEE